MTTDELLREAAGLLADVPVDPGVCARCVHSWCVGHREREKARVQWLAAYEARMAEAAADVGAGAPERQAPSCTACGDTKVILVYGEPDTCLTCAPPSAVQQALREHEETKRLIREAEERGAARAREAIDAACVSLLQRSGGYDVDREADGIVKVRDAIAAQGKDGR